MKQTDDEGFNSITFSCSGLLPLQMLDFPQFLGLVRGWRSALTLIFVLTSSTVVADTTDRQACEAAIEDLGFFRQSYSFEEGGVFRSEVHRFGDFACTVDDEQELKRYT